MQGDKINRTAVPSPHAPAKVSAAELALLKPYLASLAGGHRFRDASGYFPVLHPAARAIEPR